MLDVKLQQKTAQLCQVCTIPQREAASNIAIAGHCGQPLQLECRQVELQQNLLTSCGSLGLLHYDIWCRMVFYVTTVIFWMTLLMNK